MSEATLFELPAPQERAPAAPTRLDEARVVRPVRNQLQWVMEDLEAALPEEHPARAIWAFVERLDLSGFYASIQAVQGGPGRPASDPSA